MRDWRRTLIVGFLFAISGYATIMEITGQSIENGTLTAGAQCEDVPNAIDLARVEGAISFEQVRFGHGNTPVLDRIDLQIGAGQTVAMVGPSGSGKTTLMALLMRFYDPWSGSVRVDGHDLRTLSQKSLREQIGCVLQEPLLFNDISSGDSGSTSFPTTKVSNPRPFVPLGPGTSEFKARDERHDATRTCRPAPKAGKLVLNGW